MGILERVERIHRAHGNIKTICKKCELPETMKFYDDDAGYFPKGSFTTLCGCGMWIYKFNNVMLKPDVNNPVSYFIKEFSPSKDFAKLAFPYGKGYDPNAKNKSWLEKNGFVKQSNGKFQK